MLAADLQEIRTVRMRLRSSSAVGTELKVAIRDVLAKHDITLSDKVLSELMLTIESEFDSVAGQPPGPPLPVGINCK